MQAKKIEIAKTAEAVKILSNLREMVGDESFAKALGIVTSARPISYCDFPTAKPNEDIPVLKMGRLTVTTKITQLGEKYTNVVREEGALIIPIQFDSNGTPNIILLRQFRGATCQTFTELPAGIKDKGEESISTAIRELREETGYNVKNINQLPSLIYSGPGFTTDRQRVYLAEVEGTPKTQINHDDSKSITEVIKIPLEKAGKIIQEGKMPEDNKIDTKTAFGILFAYNKLLRK